MPRLLSMAVISVLISNLALAQGFLNIGNGNLLNTTTTYPAPYGNYYWGARHQFLIPRNELIAAGGAQGYLSSLAFLVNTPGGSNLRDFRIRIGVTTQQSITSLVENLTEVYADTLYLVGPGWNTHLFNTPFYYDGWNNLVVEVCFNNSSYTTNGIVYQTTTSYVSSLVYYEDIEGLCGLKNTSASYSQRPNMRLGFTAIAAANDVGVVQLGTPAGTVNAGNYNVNAIIRNYGSVSVSNLPLRYSVNGNWVAVDTLPGPLNPGDTVSFTFSTQASLTGSGAHYIDVACLLPNDANSHNDTLRSQRVLVCAPLSGTYTLGRPGSNFPDFALLASMLGTCGLGGTTTILVESGRYDEKFFVGSIPGSQNFSLTIKSIANDPDSVLLKYPAPANESVVKLSGSSNLTLQGLGIYCSRPGASAVKGIWLYNGADSIRVINCRIKGIYTTVTSYGVYSSGTPSHNICIDSNTIAGFNVGVMLIGTSTYFGTNNRVTGNSVQAHAYGMQFNYQDSVIIDANRVWGSQSSGDFYGVYNQNCQNGTQVSSNYITADNRSSFYGIYLSNCLASSAEAGRIFNNVVCPPRFGSGGIYGIYASGSTFQELVHNSISITAGSNILTQCIYLQTGSDFITIYGNNLVNLVGGRTIRKVSGVVNAVSDYNNLYSNGTYFGNWGASYTSFADWKTGTGQDAHSVSINPEFAGRMDLHTTSLALNGRALPLSWLGTDVDGEPRDSLSPDIGADEFTPLNIDLAPTALTAPINGDLGDTSVSMAMLLKNRGLHDRSQIPARYSTDKGLSWSPVELIADTVASDSTLAFVMTNTANLADSGYYDVHIVVSDSMDQLMLNDTLKTRLLVCSGQGLAGTYTLGHVGRDFSSFNELSRALSLCGVSGPVTIEVDSGAVFREQVIFGVLSGVNDSTRITINGNNATIITDTTYADNYYVIRFDGTDYVGINHLNVLNHATTTAWGIHFFHGADHISLDQCVLTTLNTGTMSSVLVFSDNTSHSEVAGVNGEYFTLTGCTLRGGNKCVSFYGPAGSPASQDNIFSDNYIYGFNSSGLFLRANANLKVYNNLVMDAGTDDASMGINLWACNSRTEVMGNRVEAGAKGIQVYGCQPLSPYRTLVANNMVSLRGAYNPSVGVFVDASNKTDVFNNSVWIDCEVSTCQAYGVNVTNINPADNKILNNIFRVTGSTASYAMRISNPVSLTACNYNLYHNSASSLVYYGNALPTLAALQASTSGPAGHDANSVSFDPEFFSTANLHTLSHALKDLGMPLSAVTVDFDGELRDSLHPDIGADEYRLVANDAGIAEIFVDHTAPCTGNYPVKARIRNFGTDTLSSAIVNWRVNGIPQAPYSWSGSLAPSQSSSLLILGTFSFSGGTHTILCISANPNNSLDSLAVNDSLLKAIRIHPKPAVLLLNQPSFCEDAASYLLSGGIPAGGIYTGNGIASNILNPLLAGPGNHSVKYTYMDLNGCINSDSVLLLVIARPSINLGSDTAICDNDSITLDAGSGMDSYSWSHGPGTQTITLHSSQLNYGPNLFAVQVVENGCSAMDSIWVFRAALPSVSIGSFGPFCDNDIPIALSVGSPAGGTYAGAGVSSGMFYPALTGAGQHEVSYTFTDSLGCSNSDTVLVDVLPAPAVDLGSDTTICINHTLVLDAGPGMDSYQWSGSGNAQTLTLSSANLVLGVNTFSVLVSKDGCEASDTVLVTVLPCTGLGEAGRSGNLVIFPNPNDGFFDVVVSGIAGPFRWRILAVSGTILLQGELSEGTAQPSTLRLDAHSLQPGLYFFEIEGASQSLRSPFIKMH